MSRKNKESEHDKKSIKILKNKVAENIKNDIYEYLNTTKEIESMIEVCPNDVSGVDIMICGFKFSSSNLDPRFDSHQDVYFFTPSFHITTALTDEQIKKYNDALKFMTLLTTKKDYDMFKQIVLTHLKLLRHI